MPCIPRLVPRLWLRAAVAADVAPAWELYRRLMQPLNEQVRPWQEAAQWELVARAFDANEAQIIMAGQDAVGWLHLRQGAGVLELWQIHLRPDAQGCGIGSKLIAGICEGARASGQAVALAVLKHNRARRLYERLGFEVYGSDAHELFMRWYSPPTTDLRGHAVDGSG